jgi:hypothetical protein
MFPMAKSGSASSIFFPVAITKKEHSYVEKYQWQASLRDVLKASQVAFLVKNNT